ncbi:LuxR C-terminal-related transcriptional regulator [Sphingomonas sp. OK281]|uniref:LuxR C-terminal-related transcriptional regulator n=1 Tax=Sphingomonas sp. OK281 TaxID=1881067 RepID=UPI0008E30265|nr:LuxR C-terminal-related transcriptional regulator [Sphingomonas sp. OK281]SFN66377.1 DNA-binding transcriptional regulator, CsgD family [Sphingomonas sp. OK281]
MSDTHSPRIDKQREAALARLTANEKECLRRRLLPQTAKEMATDLGISPHAVEKRLRMARAKLGVSSSLAAARLLAGAEEDQLLVPHISDLPVGTNEPQAGDVSMPSAWATSVPKGLTMIAAICLIALIAQDVPTVPTATPARPVADSSKGVSKYYGQWKTPQPNRRESIDRVHRETVFMAQGIASNIHVYPFGTPAFYQSFFYQVYIRSLSEAVVFKYSEGSKLQVIESVNPYNRSIENDINPKDIKLIKSTGDSISVFYNGSIGAIVRMPMSNTFVYATRRPDNLKAQ